MRDCPQYAAVRNLGKAKGGPNTKSEKGIGRRGGRGSGRGANSAKTDTKVEEGCDGPAAKADAAVCRSSSSSPSSTDVRWNADSGASAHMTPHREWFTKDYNCGEFPFTSPIIPSSIRWVKGPFFFNLRERGRREKICRGSLSQTFFTYLLSPTIYSRSSL
ncbi:hypothetical protein Hypma_015059 [Hypsizygus marmoreus]|uniref:Uncharacterized protein n=1 Tax=Hypsizygus marmoreus TaxID=39966 RepID=A0A369K9Y5_HYPMA|nr:hypothetical protein Hypma_015059 [Hypsizygus marmoreus]